MKLFSLSLKNIFVNWRRSISYGLFIFIITTLLIFFNSFVMTVKNNMMESLVSTLTGEILIRPAQDTGDIFTLNNSWDETYYLKSGQTRIIEEAIKNTIEPAEYTQRVRLNGLLTFRKENTPAIVIGISPDSQTYKKYFKLIKGRYISPVHSNEIVLSEEQAKSLNVDIGSIVQINTELKQGRYAAENLKVVGIGKLDLLLSMSVAYMDLWSAKKIVEKSGYNEGEISDILIYVKDKKDISSSASMLSEAIEKSGLSQDRVSVSTYESMGGFIMGTIKLYVLIFYGFIGLLMIVVSILIVNLVLMMGLERRQEIGTLRAIGFSKYRIVAIFLYEIAAITGVACTAGVALGVAMVSILEKNGFKAEPPLSFIMGSEFFMRLDKGGIIIVVIIIFTFSIMASLYPSYSAASLNPVDTLKEV